MPRVHHVKAAKDYPAQGITKGEQYYTWKIKLAYGGITYRSKTYPRPSQLTRSSFLGAIGDLQHDGFDGIEDADGLRAIAEQLREIGGEEQEKFDNMPDGLQQGPTGELLEERAQGCESWADDIDTTADELESKLDELQKEQDDSAAAHDLWEQHDNDMSDWDGDGDPPEEPDVEDPRERDFDQERADMVAEAVEEASSAAPF